MYSIVFHNDECLSVNKEIMVFPAPAGFPWEENWIGILHPVLVADSANSGLPSGNDCYIIGKTLENHRKMVV